MFCFSLGFSDSEALCRPVLFHRYPLPSPLPLSKTKLQKLKQNVEKMFFQQESKTVSTICNTFFLPSDYFFYNFFNRLSRWRFLSFLFLLSLSFSTLTFFVNVSLNSLTCFWYLLCSHSVKILSFFRSTSCCFISFC